MKRIYDWITKANQVLLFLVVIAGTILIGYIIYMSSRAYEPPHVSVAQTEEEAKASVVEDVEFLSQWSGFYVLGIMKRVVTAGGEPWLKPRVSYLGSGNDSSGQMVNIVFSKGEQRVRTLLQKDGLVLSNNLYDEKRTEKTKALVFRCVTEDTDGNHRLDENDRNDLYIIAEGLERPDIVIKGVLDFRAIAPTHLVVKTREDGAVQFRDIDIETQVEKKILWK
ncbi:MAG: hypothetical protein ABI992_12615 [Chthoniobacterales bacterium]